MPRMTPLGARRVHRPLLSDLATLDIEICAIVDQIVTSQGIIWVPYQRATGFV